MEILISIFKLCGGIGLFLFAMHLIEESLKNLSGRSFKIFLQRITKNSVSAIAGGALVTAVLQSSSLVSLMVLAFVGAGVFTMKNAMAVILGANLGTTIDSWLVATLGFKVNIEVLAYPAVFVGGLMLILAGNKVSLKNISYFLLGFGLLFIGLSFMKTAMEAQVLAFDFTKYANVSLVIFLFIGFILTLLVQSSSVTMALTLSAMHAGAIAFTPAAAIVLGSETGTTLKIMLSSVGGNAAKKRVALGNILFNIFITAFAFLLLRKIISVITTTFGITDPLIGLVTFSTLVNLFAIIIFIPLLTPFTKLLERFFRDSDASTAAFIGNANIKEPETALDLFEMETKYFIHNSLLYNLELFKIDTESLEQRSEFHDINERKKYFSLSPQEKYEFLKLLQGEIQVFYLKLRNIVQNDRNGHLSQMISAVRGCMHAVKSMKDIQSNINDLSRSSKDIKFNFFVHHKDETEKLYLKLIDLIANEKKENFKQLQDIYDTIQNNYSSALNDFYTNAQQAAIDNNDITTAINFNRELFTSHKAMLIAIKDFVLEEKEAEDFNEVPVYRT